MFVFVE